MIRSSSAAAIAVATGVVGLVLGGLGGFVLGLAVPAAEQVDQAETFDVDGVVKALDAKAGLVSRTGNPGSKCSIDSTAIGSLSEGTDVTILDSQGAKVGLGSLDAGEVSQSSKELAVLSLAECDFTFSVADIPAGEAVYTLEVGDHSVDFTQDEARALEVSITTR